MASSFKCMNFSKVLFPLKRLSNCGQIRSSLLHSNLPLKGTPFRSIVASRKELVNTCDDDLSQTFITFKYLRQIKRAVREAGPFVEENKKLATLLTRAKENKIPDDFIKFAMKIAIDQRTQLGLLEVLLENYCHIIIQYEDIDLSLTKPHLLKICDRCDGHLMPKAMKWHLHFEQVGMLFVKHDTAFKDLKEAQFTASKIGAKAVKQKTDAEGCSIWEFYCDPSELHEVKRQLIHKGCDIEEAYVGYLPKHKVVLSNSARKSLYRAIAEMSKLPTIDNVFINIM